MTRVASPRRISVCSAFTARIDAKITRKAIAPNIGHAGAKRKSSTHTASGASTTNDATNCTTDAARRSTAGQKIRWYSVPAVIATSAIVTAISAPAVSAFRSILCHTTSATPISPSATPSHCGRARRSPSSGAATMAVTSGCSASTSAAIPADMPRYCA